MQTRTNQQFQTRAKLAPATYNDADGTVDAVLSTDKPIRIYDYEQHDYVDEVLPADSAELLGQMPMLDAHSRFSVSSLLGSVREMRREGGSIVGKLYFSEKPLAEEARKDVKSGHLTDLSIGYEIDYKSSVIVPPGERAIVGGKEYTAGERTLVIRTKYKVFEASLTPLGANDEAKIRSLQEGAKPMPEITPAVNAPVAPVTPVAPIVPTRAIDVAPVVVQAPSVDINAILEKERTRTAEITTVCRQFDVSPDQHIRSGADIKDVKCAILGEIEKRRTVTVPQSARIEHGSDVVDSTRQFVENSLSARAKLDAPHKDAETRPLGLLNLARIFFRAHGENTDRMSNPELANLCFRAAGPAGSTSDFPYLLGSVLNNRLQKSYALAPSTYEMWCGIEEVADFRANYVTSVGEGADLALVPPNMDLEEDNYTETQETYSLATYGKVFGISQQAIINDQFNFFSKIAASQGRMAKNKENTLAYAILTANAALADGITLFFATTHVNKAGTPGALSPTTYSTGKAAMRIQKGVDGVLGLNLQPRFLIVPAELETMALTLANSEFVPDATNIMVKNVHRGTVTPVVEGLLSASSATSWYLACDPNQCETVIVAFLQGMRNPILEMQDAFASWGRKYRVLHSVAAKAVDYRGLYNNAGA